MYTKVSAIAWHLYHRKELIQVHTSPTDELLSRWILVFIISIRYTSYLPASTRSYSLIMSAPDIGVHHQSSKASRRINFRPPKPQNEYLWVNLEGQNLQSKTKIGQTQSFLASKSHRLRKAKKLQDLKDSIQLSPAHGHEIYPADRKHKSDDSCDSNERLARLVVHRALGVGVQEAFPVFSVSTNASLDFYFQYCMYLSNVDFEA